MTFKQFADAVNTKFLQLSETGALFRVNVSKEQLWETYQNSYSPQDNPIFRERRVHECNTCMSFINRLGPIVAIIDNTLDSIWNIEGLSHPYDKVAKAMHDLVVSHNVSSIFVTDETLVGKEYNIEANEAGDIKWEHFYATISEPFVSENAATIKGDADTTVSVFKRALEEFSIETLTTVIELCDTIYRGEEFKPTVVKFLKAKQEYEASENKPLFIWQNYTKYPAKIRNSAIGTLIIDLEKDIELEEAVSKYEKVVAPENYKRTTAVFTEGMKKQALKTIDELNYRESLPRRAAVIEDISVNNVLFVDRDVKTHMKDPLDEIFKDTATVASTPSSATEISIDQFITTVLPAATNIEALVENRHTANFVSLVAPVNHEAPNMLKWNNNFSWSYKGEVTDSMKERVKAAGGSVNGVLRCTLQWNEDNRDRDNDLDLHCVEPRNHIYFGNKGTRHPSSGMLDVDITSPGNLTAVENIIYTDLQAMPDGDFKFYVNNYSGRNSKGFRAQIEFDGVIHEFNYPTTVTSDVAIAIITKRNGKLEIAPKLKSSQSQKTEWDVKTLQYQKVSTIMLSPNFWDGQAVGNKHFFFMLEGCQNPSAIRGFYNEFLSNKLTPHRKVFETLSAAMKCEPTTNQLSGVGFSSTLNNHIHLKVDGRPYKVIIKG